MEDDEQVSVTTVHGPDEVSVFTCPPAMTALGIDWGYDDHCVEIDWTIGPSGEVIVLGTRRVP